MIMKQELVKRIREHFDLNIYETKVWIALLTKGIASAGEVAEISGVPRSRTYDVLESLEKRGFAMIRIGKPVKYLAVKPTEVIEKIKANALVNAQERVKSLSGLKDSPEYKELEGIYEAGIVPIKSQEITAALRGRSNIISRLREIIESAKKELSICTSLSDLEDKSRILMPLLEKAVKKNIKVKLALSGDIEGVKKFNAKSELKARHIESDARIFMADKNEILFIITPLNSNDEIGVWLNSPFFTESLAGIIENSLRNQLNIKK